MQESIVNGVAISGGLVVGVGYGNSLNLRVTRLFSFFCVEAGSAGNSWRENHPINLSQWRFSDNGRGGEGLYTCAVGGSPGTRQAPGS